MNIDENIEKLEERIKHNASKIENNAQLIQQNTGALEILRTFKADSQKFFTMWIITFFAFIVLLGYTIYLLNDISTIHTQEVEQENTDGNNNFIGRDGDING